MRRSAEDVGAVVDAVEVDALAVIADPIMGREYGLAEPHNAGLARELKWGRAGSNQRGQKEQKGRALTGFAAGQPMVLIYALTTARVMSSRAPAVITPSGEGVAALLVLLARQI